MQATEGEKQRKARNTRENLLKPLQCKHAKAGKHNDGAGLHLFVSPEGAKVWRWRFFLAGRERMAGGGPYRDEGSKAKGRSLTEARQWRNRLRDILRDGRDPLVVQRDERAREALNTPTAQRERTLEYVATRYHTSIVDRFRNEKHQRQWLSSLQPVFDKLGGRAIDDIKAGDLIDVIAPVMRETPETAKRIIQRVRAVYDSQVLRGKVAVNPAALLHKAQELRRPKQERHLRAAAFADMPALVAALRATDRVSPSVKGAILFALATAARSGEVRGATWGEIDRRARLWSIPGARMKAGEPHSVHLSQLALDVLREAEALRANDDSDALLFPAPADASKPLSDMSLTMALRRLETGHKRADGEPETFSDLTTIHGAARSAFSTFGNERGWRGDVVEAALAHKEADAVRRAYNRSVFERERRELLDAWGKFISTPTRKDGGKVLPFQRRKRAS